MIHLDPAYRARGLTPLAEHTFRAPYWLVEDPGGDLLGVVVDDERGTISQTEALQYLAQVGLFAPTLYPMRPRRSPPP